MAHLADIFCRLEKAGLKLKLSKCDFFKEKVEYLGHIISGQGIEPDPDKIKVIKELSPPTNVREVRSIIGMASYCRRFIDQFSKITQPLTELAKKHTRFAWTPERQQAFESLKQKLSCAPVLAHPDMSRPFKLYTDATLYAVGAILTQDFDAGENVIQYISKKLSPGQQKWPAIEKRLMPL